MFARLHAVGTACLNGLRTGLDRVAAPRDRLPAAEAPPEPRTVPSTVRSGGSQVPQGSHDLREPDPRPMRERLVDVMLFLLGQTPDPTREDWLGAIDDLFGELDESEKQRLAEAGMALVSTHARPAAPLRLVHANPAAAQTKPAAPNQPAATPKRLAAEGGRAARLEAVA